MIYLDHNATTPVDSNVISTVNQAMNTLWGNPSSLHAAGDNALMALEKSRIVFSQLLNVDPSELFFTSGGTESNNIAIKGFCREPDLKNEILISSIEHPSIKESVASLVKDGFKIIEIPVDLDGFVDLDFIEENLSEKTALISVMHANNETGVIQPVEKIGELTKKDGIKFHCDAVQTFGKIPINISNMNVSSLSISSHKIYGPKGVGLLFAKKNSGLEPLFFGGHQERKIRPGTQNVPGIVGFSKSAELICSNQIHESNRLFALTELLFSKLNSRIDNIVRNGSSQKRVPNTLNVSFPGTISEILVPLLDEMGIMVSGGSACASGSTDPSYVISAMGRRLQDAISAIRFSLGSSNTEEDIDIVVSGIEKVVKRIRNLK